MSSTEDEYRPEPGFEIFDLIDSDPISPISPQLLAALERYRSLYPVPPVEIVEPEN
jgi:hypothetical protein